MMKKKLFVIVLMVAILSVATLPAFASAAIHTNTYQLNDKKFAIAQWTVTTPGGTHIINAVVNMSNNEKDGWLYINVKHAAGAVSNASAPVEFKWSMDHVTVDNSIFFAGTGIFSGTHNVTITWQTSGPTSNTPTTVSTTNGISATINGNWKSGSAGMTLDLTATTGHHKDSQYTADFAYVAKGDASVTITL